MLLRGAANAGIQHDAQIKEQLWKFCEILPRVQGSLRQPGGDPNEKHTRNSPKERASGATLDSPNERTSDFSYEACPCPPNTEMQHGKSAIRQPATGGHSHIVSCK